MLNKDRFGFIYTLKELLVAVITPSVHEAIPSECTYYVFYSSGEANERL